MPIEKADVVADKHQRQHEADTPERHSALSDAQSFIVRQGGDFATQAHSPQDGTSTPRWADLFHPLSSDEKKSPCDRIRAAHAQAVVVRQSLFDWFYCHAR